MKTDPVPSGVGQTLHRVIRERPGIHFRALERAAGLSSAGQLRHHLDQLARRGHLVELRDGGYSRFFIANDHDRNLRPLLARFARPVPRRIAKILLRGPATRTELRKALSCADSTLGYYLSRMHRHGDLVKVERRGCTDYALADPDAVRQVFEAQPDAPDGRPVARVLPPDERRRRAEARRQARIAAEKAANLGRAVHAGRRPDQATVPTAHNGQADAAADQTADQTTDEGAATVPRARS